MPNRKCEICNRLQSVTTADWKLLDHTGDFVCSTNCLLSWINQSALKECLLNAFVEKGEISKMPDSHWPEYKSKYELKFAAFLGRSGLSFKYEKYLFWLEKEKVYIPDFYVRDKCFIETKGKWGVGQKTKMTLFRDRYSWVPLIVVPWILKDQFK